MEAIVFNVIPHSHRLDDKNSASKILVVENTLCPRVSMHSLVNLKQEGRPIRVSEGVINFKSLLSCFSARSSAANFAASYFSAAEGPLGEPTLEARAG